MTLLRDDIDDPAASPVRLTADQVTVWAGRWPEAHQPGAVIHSTDGGRFVFDHHDHRTPGGPEPSTAGWPPGRSPDAPAPAPLRCAGFGLSPGQGRSGVAARTHDSQPYDQSTSTAVPPTTKPHSPQRSHHHSPHPKILPHPPTQITFL
jgi:hypothetical protein